ncbi:histidine phosphatase family protein [Brachybacterium sp. YJGR34]|uniref:histidine phosphatase family protein n=1 Tax=Brachybacterium sp. YJGR34 TaxID=2059911 RepID=UPI000E0A74EF|nr:histidine phosphatase family protein [Brachybacterium sp. YJGR34]
MTRRTLYVARHGEADAWGVLTERGREQSRRLGRRLAALPIDVVWHSPLPRAADSAAEIAGTWPGVLVDEAPELVDHVPQVPDLDRLSPVRRAFFDGVGAAEIAEGGQRAAQLLARFAVPNPPGARASHEVLVTHAYQVAWLVRAALGAPPERWMSLAEIDSTGLTILELERDEPPRIRCLNELSHLAGVAG